MRRATGFVPALALTTVLGSEAAYPTRLFRAPFHDGSARSGPELILIPEGDFRMGSLSKEPEYRLTAVPHRVELPAFALGRYEVTNEELAEFLNEMGNDDGGLPYVNISRRGSGLLLVGTVFCPAPGAARLPVTGVSWHAALAYGQWLSSKTGPQCGGGDAARPEPVGSRAPNAFGLFELLGNVWEWTLDCFEMARAVTEPSR